jgi:hypothetical protein
MNCSVSVGDQATPSPGGVLFAHAIAFQRKLVNLMHEKIENGVSERWILQSRLSVLKSRLTGNDCRAGADAQVKSAALAECNIPDAVNRPGNVEREDVSYAWLTPCTGQGLAIVILA